MYAIQTQNTVKKYKNGVRALNGINISVKTGEIFSLLGQNGAGKSTLIKILTTYLKPTSGKVIMFNQDIHNQTDVVRSAIACVAQQTSIDTHLSLEENMMFQSRLYKIPKAKAKEKIEELIRDFELEQYRNYPVSSYSGGVKRRLDIALNMMSNPKILFLDEPTVGMDIQSRMRMWDMLLKIRDHFGTTIFLTTHYLEEADQLSDTICIMKDGKDVIQGTPLQLRSLIHQDSLQIQFLTQNEVQECLPLFQQLFVGRSVFARNKSIIVNIQNSHSDMEKAMNFLLKNHIPCQSIQIIQPTLEDVFLRLTTKKEQEVKKENECLGNITQKY